MSWLNESALELIDRRRMIPMSREARRLWLANRRQGIGASDAAVVLGRSSYKTAYELWHEKLGLKGDGEMTEEQMWGLVHEENVATMYAIRTGYEVHKVKEFTRHPTHPFRYATLDRAVADRIVQIKTSATYSGWGPDGTDQVPEHILLQVTHEMDCAGAALCDVPALLCGNRMRIYTVPFNPVLAEIIHESQVQFWDLVQRRVPPTPDWGHETTARFIGEMQPPEAGRVAELPVTHAAHFFAHGYLEANEKIGEWEEKKETLKAKLIFAMQDAARVNVPDGGRVVRGKQFRVYPPKEVAGRVGRPPEYDPDAA
jgi:putative phage-type endonuclease